MGILPKATVHKKKPQRYLRGLTILLVRPMITVSTQAPELANPHPAHAPTWAFFLVKLASDIRLSQTVARRSRIRTARPRAGP